MMSMSTSSVAYRSLRGGPRTNLADLVPLPAPFTVYLEPTNICNFKCSYCPVHFDDYAERSGGLGRLTLEDCTRVFRDILALGRLRTLNLYMLGEPFANKRLPEFIALAKQLDVADRVIVTTNATLIDEAMARRTIESRLDYLRVSIYGTSNSRSAQVTNSKIPLDRIVANVTRLKSIRDERGSAWPHIYVKMIDAGDAEDNKRFLELFGPISDQAAVEPAMNWNLPKDEVNLSGPHENLDAEHFRHKKAACPFPFYSLVVNADLRVTVCCVDWEKATEIGNLRDQTLQQIWHGEALRDFRLKHLEGGRHNIAACRSCTFLHTAPDNLDAVSPATFLDRETKMAASAAG
jgi:radical SAM protein with 4Fe4S-binding SPASM domain